MAEGGYRPLQSVRSIRCYEWIMMIVLTMIPLVGGFLGARLFNTGAYKKDEFLKPDWAPSPKVFSPVWSILYLAMGFASYLIWKVGGGLNRETIPPLFLYTVQLLLNWSWTPLFFGWGLFGGAQLVITAVWGLVLACCVTFPPVSKVAGILMFPYLVWVSFASALNYSIACQNGCYMDSSNSTNSLGKLIS